MLIFVPKYSDLVDTKLRHMVAYRKSTHRTIYQMPFQYDAAYRQAHMIYYYGFSFAINEQALYKSRIPFHTDAFILHNMNGSKLILYTNDRKCYCFFLFVHHHNN